MRETTWEVAYTPKLCPICLVSKGKETIMKIEAIEDDGTHIVAHKCRVCGFSPDDLTCSLADANESVCLPYPAYHPTGGAERIKTLPQSKAENRAPVLKLRRCDTPEQLMQVAQSEFPESIDIEGDVGVVKASRLLKPIAVPSMGETETPYGIQISYGTGAREMRDDFCVESIWKGQDFEEPKILLAKMIEASQKAMRPSPEVVHRVIPQLVTRVEESYSSGSNLNTKRGAGEVFKIRKRAYTG